VLRWCQDHPGALLASLLGFILVVTAVAVLLVQLASGPGAAPGPGEFAGAGKKLAVQKEGPDEFALRLERGHEALKAKRVDEAIDAFAAALELRPADLDAEKLLAEARAIRDEEALRRREQQEKVERQEKRAQLIQEARAALAKNDLDAAGAKFGQAEKLGPDGALRLLRDELDRAHEKLFRERRREDALAKSAAALAAGDRALKLKQFGAAIAAYDDALKVLTAAGLDQKKDREASDRSERAAAARANAQRLAQLQAGPDGLQGTWIVQSVRVGEKELSLKDLPVDGKDGKQFALTFSGNKFRAAGGPSKGAEGTFTIDSSKNPKHLDVTEPKDGKVQRMIYRIEGDTLIIAGSQNTENRPSAFDGKDTIILVLKRATK
jgi:uncharacterized protein (TIGR03067 family)